MPTRIPPLVSLLFALMTPPALEAVGIRHYEAGQHDRFHGAIDQPVRNPDQLFAHLDTTGIGWLANAPNIQVALVSRQHLVFASHYAAVLDDAVVCFLGASGKRVERRVVGRTIVREGSEPTDLTLLTLDAPIDAGEGVRPLAILDLAGCEEYQGCPIGVAGRAPSGGGTSVIARDVIDQVEASPRHIWAGEDLGMLNTRFLRFRFPIPDGAADEGYFERGDSGSPTFVDCGDCPALVGVHSYTQVLDLWGTESDRYENYDVFVPHYASRLDALMEPLGFRMRRTDAPETSLSGVVRALQPVPRAGGPLTLEFSLENEGGHAAGNLEIELEFAPGQEPDQVDAGDWIVGGGGSSWTLRRATVDPGQRQSLRVSWASAPDGNEVAPVIRWRSDASAEASVSPVIELAPSFAAWASGLEAAGEDDDPDGDGMVNLLEYAFGRDPGHAEGPSADGGPRAPRLVVAGGEFRLEHAEREDKALRGLGYRVEYSSDLVTWTPEAPAGTHSSTEAFLPERPGFVRRIVTGAVDAPYLFVRVAVTLDE